MNLFICSLLIAACCGSFVGCMKLGKKGSLKTDVDASLTEDDVRAFMERITGVADTPTSVTVKGDTLIFKARSERAIEVSYAFEKSTNQKDCTSAYSEWFDIETRITVPGIENGAFKMCLKGRYGTKESETSVVYDIKIEPEDATALENNCANDDDCLLPVP